LPGLSIRTAGKQPVRILEPDRFVVAFRIRNEPRLGIDAMNPCRHVIAGYIGRHLQHRCALCGVLLESATKPGSELFRRGHIQVVVLR
jgi:hypothetical protein